MKVSIIVDVAEAIKNGYASSRSSDINVSDGELQKLSEEDRSLLAEHLSYSYNGGNCNCGLLVKKPSLEGILEAIKSEVESKAAEKAAEAVKSQEMMQRAANKLAELDKDQLISMVMEKGFSSYGCFYLLEGVDYKLSEAMSNLPEAQEIVQACDAANNERKIRLAEKEKQDKEDEKLRQAIEKVQVGEWIRAFGSKRLKRMLEEEIECKAVYRDERLAAERPGWVYYNDIPERTHDPRNPPESAFDILDEARKVEPEAVLEFIDNPSRYVAVASFMGENILWGYEPAEDDDEDDDNY